MHLNSLLLTGLLLAFSCFSVQAQETVSGQVTDPEGTPLTGVNIIVKNTLTGAVTDVNGQFSIAADSDDILLFSYIGFQSWEVTVGPRRTIDVVLDPAIAQLERIVVVGYGSLKKKDVTGATESLEAENFNPGIVHAPEQLLQGKLAGVELVSNSGEPGAGFSVRIRGANTIRAGNEPLYVIDGYPLDIATTTPGNASAAAPLQIGSQGKNPLTFLNPADIASIHVLKDASAAAIYGARAANGVVLIETRSGRSGRPRLTYAAYADVARLRQKIDVLSAEEWRAAQAANGFSGNDFGADTDWQEETFRTAFTHNHDLSVEGGSQQTTYRASFQYLDQEGIANGNDWTRLGGRVKIRQKALRDRLTLLGNVNLARIRDKPASGGGVAVNPTYPVYNEDGSLFRPSPTSVTPEGAQQWFSDLVTTNRLLASLTASFDIFDDLEYKINFGGDNAVSTRRTNEAVALNVERNGQATISEREIGSVLIEHYLTYTGDWTDHDLTALGGYSYQKFITKDFLLSRAGFVSDEILNVNNIAAGTELVINESGVEKSALQSFFARLNYQFRDRYLLTANVRADGSTRFGRDNRYGFFPSLALAWRFSEEAFLKDIPFLDQLKLRASWGLTGNQEIPNKITQFVLGTPPFSNYVLNGSDPTVGYGFIRTPNDQLQWEETRQINAGLDFSFWQGRLSGSVDYFDKRTTELLVEIFAASAPTVTAWTNLDAEVLNRGLEVAVGGVPWRSGRFQWETSLAFTMIDNEVRGMPTDLFPRENQIITNGEPLGAFWGREWLGFDEQGLNRFLQNPDGSDALLVVGRALPDFSWGWTHQFRFGVFDLGFMFRGVQGGVIHNETTPRSKVLFPFGANVPAAVLATNESFGNAARFSSRFLEDGSFVRLQYVTLGYRIPANSIDWLESLRVYLTGANLLLWTDYTGYDPEVNIFQANADRFGRSSGIPALGVDRNAYPRARSVQVGVQVAFR